MNLTIKHDNKNKKFFAIIGGKECSLRYEKLHSGIMDAKLMFVPKNMRGQGIASKLVEQAVSYAKRNNLKIKPTCSYIEEYLQNTPKHKEILFTGEYPKVEPVESVTTE